MISSNTAPKRHRNNKPYTTNAHEKIIDAGRRGVRRRQRRGTDEPADPGRSGGPHRETGKRNDLLHPPQRKAERPGRFLHPPRRGSHPGERFAAGPRPLPGTHGLQRNQEPPGQTAHGVSGDRGREIRRQPQCRHELGLHVLQHEGRADLARRNHRLGAADPARLVALHRAGAVGNRLGARRDHGGAAHARRRVVAFDDEAVAGAGQRHEIRAPQPDRLPRRAEELPAQGAGGFLQTMVPSGLPGRNRGRRHRRGCHRIEDQDADGRHSGSRRRRIAEGDHRGSRQRGADRQHLHRSRNAGYEGAALHQAPGGRRSPCSPTRRSSAPAWARAT